MITFSPEGRTELIAAFVAAQTDMESVYKDAKNPHFNMQYATLAAVLDAIIPALSKHNLAFIQSPSYENDLVSVETVIAHIGGGIMSTTLSARPAKQDPQGIGSVVTYLRRYSAMAIAGVAPEDDDGNAGSLSSAPKRAAPKNDEAADKLMAVIRAKMAEATEADELAVIWTENKTAIGQMLTKEQNNTLVAEMKSRKAELSQPATETPFDDPQPETFLQAYKRQLEDAKSRDDFDNLTKRLAPQVADLTPPERAQAANIAAIALKRFM